MQEIAAYLDDLELRFLNRYNLSYPMKHTQPGGCLSIALLRYVRDAEPTEEALLHWLGEDVGRYHVLRKAGLLSITDRRIRLSPAHLSEDGRSFRYENRLFLLDEDKELIF